MPRPDTPSLAEWLESEPFTLGMSAGLCGFYAHAGTLSALAERDLLPDKTRGASAGALVVGLWTAGLEPERIQEELASVERDEFWDPGIGFGLLKGELFDEKLRGFVGDIKIEDCDTPTHVSVTDVYRREAEELKSGDLVQAIRASCALPGLFHPVLIDGRPKLDGGIKDHPGLAKAPPDERIFFHNLPSRGLRSKLDRGDAQAFEGRSNTSILEIAGIPRVTPFTLHRGMDAFQYTREHTQEALSQPVQMLGE